MENRTDLSKMPFEEGFDRLEQRLDRWADGVNAKLDNFGKQVDEWSPRMQRKIEEWELRKHADLYTVRLQVAEMYPSFLANMSDPRTSSEFIRQYGKAHDEFLKWLTPFVASKVKFLPEQERAKHARWACSTIVDQFLNQAQAYRNQDRQRQLLLTGRKVFSRGVELSEQYGSAKIEQPWINEVAGNIINPKVNVLSVKNQLKIFIDGPPLTAKE